MEVTCIARLYVIFDPASRQFLAAIRIGGGSPKWTADVRRAVGFETIKYARRQRQFLEKSYKGLVILAVYD